MPKLLHVTTCRHVPRAQRVYLKLLLCLLCVRPKVFLYHNQISLAQASVGFHAALPALSKQFECCQPITSTGLKAIFRDCVQRLEEGSPNTMECMPYHRVAGSSISSSSPSITDGHFQLNTV